MHKPFSELPRYVRIDLSDVYERLDKLSANTNLPTIDTEAALSALVDVLYKPSVNRSVEDTVRFIIVENMGIIGSDIANYQLLYTELYNALFSLLGVFKHYQLYVENRLLYDYARRFTKTTALLERKSNPYL